MADFQGDVMNKEEEIAKKAGQVTSKVIAYVFKELPKFPHDFPFPAQPKEKHGKMEMKHLMRKDSKLEDIQISESNVKDFNATARKYGIDYSLKKETQNVNGEDKTNYIVFFKAKDRNVMEAAFKEYGQRKLDKDKKLTITEKLDKKKEQNKSKDKNRERSRDKKKSKEQSL